MNRGIQLAQEAVREFGAGAFWTLPATFEARTRAQARMVAGILRKHGGRAGWIKGKEIDDAIDRIAEAGASAPLE